MFNFGATELIIILIIVLLIFGPSRLGDIGSSLGKGIKGFRKSIKDDEIDVTPEKQDTKKVENNEFSSPRNSLDKEESKHSQ